jgi:hypothetical protein
MKSKLFIIIILYFSKNLIAQDSLRVETVVDSTFKTPQYVAAYDDVFLSHQETKWLLKGDFMGLFGQNNGGVYYFTKPIGFEFERKLSNSISINAGLKTDFIARSSTNNIPIVMSLEARWFLNQKKLQAANQSENNLNGSYVSLRGRMTKSPFLNLAAASEILNNASITLNYGIQKRVFNNMYFNYRLGLGVIEQPLNSFIKQRWDLGFENEFTLGLTLSGGKKKTVNSCDFFRCFETEQNLWKFDISKLLPVFNKYNMSSSLNAAYEFKLGDSKAWSINTNLDIYLRRLKFVYAPISDQNFYFQTAYLSVAPRYYYNINKDIARGKSANNLSGCYFSLEVGAGVRSSLQKLATVPGFAGPGYDPDDFGVEHVLKIIPKWGIQKRLSKNGFIDFSFAPYWFMGKDKGLNNDIIGGFNGKNDNFLKTDIKIGFAF